MKHTTKCITKDQRHIMTLDWFDKIKEGVISVYKLDKRKKRYDIISKHNYKYRANAIENYEVNKLFYRFTEEVTVIDCSYIIEGFKTAT